VLPAAQDGYDSHRSKHLNGHFFERSSDRALAVSRERA
jgi:hypothetical protein